MIEAPPRDIAPRLLSWFDRHGRKDLPWQRTPTPYRVWVSEIMLQQTQVATVIDYFTRFMQRFADVTQLAHAPLDEVLGLWSGLGYYARARNLHRSANIIVERHDGHFPSDLDALMALPGVGRSTAGAILALSFGSRVPILDGNVKRVLTRHRAIHGWPARRAVERKLWAVSQALLPATRVADYTQAIMDLGATVCLARAAQCTQCPIAEDCVARARGEVEQLPTAKPRKALPTRETVFLLARRHDSHHILLEQRPPTGIWGGLWCFPECERDDEAIGHALASRGLSVRELQWLAPMRHTFSHFHLAISPVLATVSESVAAVRDAPLRRWVDAGATPAIGLATPVVRLLERIAAQHEDN